MEMQLDLEGISEQLRIPGSKALGPITQVLVLVGLQHPSEVGLCC
jgi:hypothetical protein